MGGGNAQKSAKAREKNAEKAKAAGKGSQLKANASALTLKCHVCLQTFISTSNKSKLLEHAEAKHPKLAAIACFPDIETMA